MLHYHTNAQLFQLFLYIMYLPYPFQEIRLFLSARDKSENFFSEGYDHASSESQKPVGTLRGIVALKRQTDLNNAPAEQDNADCTNQAEDEIRQVVNDSQWVVCCSKCRNRQTKDKS